MLFLFTASCILLSVGVVQLPGRENRFMEPLFISLIPLVETLAKELSPYFKFPYAFFGHSMGALISFELARKLRKQNISQPVHLFVSAHRAPQLPDPLPPIHQLPQSQFVEEIRKYQRTSETILQEAELLELFLPILRADFAICETYNYLNEPPLNCPITVFGGEQDDISQQELIFWQDQTTNAFTLQMLPGHDFFIKSAQALLLQGSIIEQVSNA